MARQAVPPQNQASLSDHTLMQLLEKLQQYEPVTIGLDIYRDFPVNKAVPKLSTYLQQDNFYGICKVKSPDSLDPTGIAPSPDMTPRQIGFADAVTDRDGVLRRHLLSMRRSADATDLCTATNHLSLLIAIDYFHRTREIGWEITPKQELQLGDVVLQELTPDTGGYHNEDTLGRQILLNYRSRPDPTEVAETITVTNILEDQIPADTLETLKNRIILIGITGSVAENPDYWRTPYSVGQLDTAGIFIQAHKISQLISAVLDGRPLLKGWPWWGELLWIWGWSCMAGILTCVAEIIPMSRLRHGLWLGVCVMCVPGSLLGTSYVLLLYGWWVPCIPTVMGVGLTWVGYLVIARLTSQQCRTELSVSER